VTATPGAPGGAPVPAGEELRGGGLGTPGKRPGKAGRMDCRDRGTIATVLEEEERIAEPVPGGGGICKKKHGRQRHCRRFFFKCFPPLCPTFGSRSNDFDCSLHSLHKYPDFHQVQRRPYIF
jgi:hypothetical protein